MKRVILAALIVLLAGPLSVAATIDAGTWYVNQAAGQTVTVEVYTATPETTLALNFYASLVNGPDNSLVFTALDFDVTDATYGAYMFYDGLPTPSPYYGTSWSGSATTAQGGAGAFDPPLGSGPNPILGTPASPAGRSESLSTHRPQRWARGSFCSRVLARLAGPTAPLAPLERPSWCPAKSPSRPSPPC